MPSASELARLHIERWNAGELEDVFASWDPDIVVCSDPYYPDSAELVGAEPARRFWLDQVRCSGVGRLEIVDERIDRDRGLAAAGLEKHP